jgi:hypothetical protein
MPVSPLCCLDIRKTDPLARHWWLTPVILAIQEAEIRRMGFEASSGKQFTRPYLEKTHHKKRAGGVVQGEDPEFKPQHQINK